jgi:hypothetical protein
MSSSKSAEDQIHQGVVALLGSDRGERPAFVACLHELALSEASLDWIPPKKVFDSAIRSGNLHTGVRILEKYLLTAGMGSAGMGSAGMGSAEASSSGKRARISSGHVTGPGTDAEKEVRPIIRSSDPITRSDHPIQSLTQSP